MSVNDLYLFKECVFFEPYFFCCSEYYTSFSVKHLKDLVNSVVFFTTIQRSCVIVAYIFRDTLEQQPLAAIQLIPTHQP